MIQRKCPECSSELVRAKIGDAQRASGIVPISSPGWRCSVCGREFTALQIRDSKRAKAAVAEHA